MQNKTEFSNKPVWYIAVITVFLAGILIFYQAISPPAQFSKNKVITIERGTTVSNALSLLADKHIIRHPLLLRLIIKLDKNEIKAGNYYFSEPQNVWQISQRLSKGDYQLQTVKVTFPEGTSVVQMAGIASAQLPLFDSKYFLKIAKDKEGFLFPDTYFFSAVTTASDVYQALTENFNKKVRSGALADQIGSSGKSLIDIITMASLIEEEAKTADSRRIISGILWKRLSVGMPLQVDSSFSKVFSKTYNKTVTNLSLKDLNSNSPYNTYKFSGLPPGPITNPGMDAIQAALNPTKTKYLYYLSDKTGAMHYAVTFDEHIRNKQLYLK